MTAIENKKKLTIFVEAKARFDEENNILWGKALQEKGAQVVFSVPNIKVHAKIAMVEREEPAGLRRYAYIGTGNFNRNTAKIYCDHGIFTTDTRITDDLHQVFLVLEKRLIIPKLKYLLVSPYSTRTVFMELIENEIANCSSGKGAGIALKMNGLEDPGMIDALCKANASGVPVRLLIRGFCCLNPESTDGPSMKITSIVDRFLEHGRLYLFENNGNPKMFLGSADWMTRNMDKRIEVLVPILDARIFAELSLILRLQLEDNVKARAIDARDTNTRLIAEDGIRQHRSQYQIYEYFKKMLGAELEQNNAEYL
jgi:polyphosphate kinase